MHQSFLRSRVFPSLIELQSATVVEILILAMVLYPETLRAAQNQIDKVVGRDRLPTFQDLDDLSYLHAVAKEILRWRPPAPLCKCYIYSKIYPLDCLLTHLTTALPKRCTQVGMKSCSLTAVSSCGRRITGTMVILFLKVLWINIP